MLESLFITTATGFVITLATQISKKTGISTRFLLFSFTAAAAIGYAAFCQFASAELQQSIVEFSVQSLGFAVAFYEFVYKSVKS